MSQNNSTFDAGFNVTTPDFSALDSRYVLLPNVGGTSSLFTLTDPRFFKITQSFSELSGSTHISTSVSASRNIFGSGSNAILTDCTIRSSGSNSILRFNNPTGDLPANQWKGALIVDETSPSSVYTSDGTAWLPIINSYGGTITNGSLKISGSHTFSITSSVGSKIGIAHPNYTLLELSASTSDSNIITHNDLYFRSGSKIIGQIKKEGGINFTSGSFNLGAGSNTVNGNLTVKGFLSASSITCSGDIIAFSTSDERLKENIVVLSNNLKNLDIINAYSFDWKVESGRSGKSTGVIAQEIEKILPTAVITRPDGYKAVDYEQITAYLLGCIKELYDLLPHTQKNISKYDNRIKYDNTIKDNNIIR